MRGKDGGSGTLGTLTGITPAHAGKSWNFKNVIQMNSGSPPHMRGKELTVTDRFQTLGITPAHAGKRLCLLFYENVARDHPRTCGEKQHYSLEYCCR